MCHTFSFDNRNLLKKADKCGCFYCKKIYSPDRIKDWTDEGRTAICPYCKVDAVIPEIDSIEVTEELLNTLHKKYF